MFVFLNQQRKTAIAKMMDASAAVNLFVHLTLAKKAAFVVHPHHRVMTAIAKRYAAMMIVTVVKIASVILCLAKNVRVETTVIALLH